MQDDESEISMAALSPLLSPTPDDGRSDLTHDDHPREDDPSNGSNTGWGAINGSNFGWGAVEGGGGYQTREDRPREAQLESELTSWRSSCTRCLVLLL